MAAIAATGRRTAVLCGFETDVCVTHSAVGLMEAGYRVVVATDAVYSPAGAQAFGLARLRDLGVELVHCKGIYYDWVRTLEAALAFQREHPDTRGAAGILDLKGRLDCSERVGPMADSGGKTREESGETTRAAVFWQGGDPRWRARDITPLTTTERGGRVHRRRGLHRPLGGAADQASRAGGRHRR